MARFQPRIEIHNLPPITRARLQPGQHITAGGASGRWCGQTRNGIDVAAWSGNAGRFPGGRLAYWRELRRYALAYGAQEAQAQAARPQAPELS
jgi:hypothetical protein